MRIHIYSRKRMEAELKKEGKLTAAIISFHDPADRKRPATADEAPLDFSGRADRVLQIPLHDLDPQALASVGLTVETYFPEADAVADFVYTAKEEGLDIICQCEYGQSRSAGCAAAILQHFSRRGIDIFADYRYYPNQLVYHKVKDALDRRKSRPGADPGR